MNWLMDILEKTKNFLTEKKVVKRLIITAIIAYLLILALNIIFSWRIFDYFSRKMFIYGISGYLGGIIAVWITAIIFWFGPNILLAFAEQKKSWIWKAALLISICLGTMYILSFSGSDNLFDPSTGKPFFRYSIASNGEIEKFPLSFTTNPQTGVPLYDFNADIAEKYLKQQRHARENSEFKALFIRLINRDRDVLVYATAFGLLMIFMFIGSLIEDDQKEESKNKTLAQRALWGFMGVIATTGFMCLCIYIATHIIPKT